MRKAMALLLHPRNGCEQVPGASTQRRRLVTPHGSRRKAAQPGRRLRQHPGYQSQHDPPRILTRLRKAVPQTASQGFVEERALPRSPCQRPGACAGAAGRT